MSTSIITANGKATAAEPTAQVLAPPIWVDGNPTLQQITDDILRPLEARPGKGWWICFAISYAALLKLEGMVGYLVAKGIGIWGLNNSVGDRKSTRLNSSHANISYAVFSLTKNNTETL